MARSSHGTGSRQVSEIASEWRASLMSSSVLLFLCLPRRPDPAPYRVCLQVSCESRGQCPATSQPLSSNCRVYGSRGSTQLEVPGRRETQLRDCVYPHIAQGTVATGATRAGGVEPTMRSPNSEFQPSPAARASDREPRRPTGDPRGDDVSPVSSDATGVRENGGERGREDATRPRRRYITY